MCPVPEPDPATPTPLPPSGGTIDIHSSNPPVVSSSKHPVAISSSDIIGPEDTNPGLRIVSAKKAKVVVFPTLLSESHWMRQYHGTWTLCAHLLSSMLCVIIRTNVYSSVVQYM
ncbi:hypothetical protein FRC12_001684 [Ceratobasidium sp. 428]|nr:hypothetical protein FRC12_001684 [Ceratobasidium sp. 428]